LGAPHDGTSSAGAAARTQADTSTRVTGGEEARLGGDDVDAEPGGQRDCALFVTGDPLV
jgi:hypothetical protein